MCPWELTETAAWFIDIALDYGAKSGVYEVKGSVRRLKVAVCVAYSKFLILPWFEYISKI